MRLINIVSSLLLVAGTYSCSNSFIKLQDSSEKAKMLYIQYPEINALYSAESKLKRMNGYQIYFDPDVQREYTSQTRALDSANRIVMSAFNQAKHETEKSDSAGNWVLPSLLTAWAGPFIWAWASDRKRAKANLANK